MIGVIKKLARKISPWLTRCLVALVTATCMLSTAQAQIWSEEFNTGTAPDSATWSYDLGNWGWGNQELQNYTSDPANVRVEGGNLIITALRDGNNFSSARIKTLDKLTFKYGTVEARIQIPDLANGLWPAFWTLGNNFPTIGWPHCGEIDVMEMGIGGAINDGVVNRRVGSHFHWDNNGGYANYGLSLDLPSDINGTFVVYRMEWTPTEISTYIDGQWIVTMNTSSIPEFNEPHFFLLNMAVGGTYTGIYDASGITASFPAEYKVDWIRIYDNGYTVLGPAPPEPSTPYYGTPLAIPGTIEAEDYDNGGENSAYHDTGAVNDGGSYRTSEGVDIEVCTDTGGGYDVGWTVAGEWMKYTVDVASAGDYTITSRVARGAAGTGAFHIEVDDVDVTGSITVEDTGGWQNWVDKTSNVTLTSGEQVVKIVIEAGDININHIAFAAAGPPNDPPVFTSNPVVKANATEDAAYTGQTLAGDATDPESDPLSFSRVAGPSWLNVASDGALSGTPGAGDVGANVFTVKVEDAALASDTATLNITVDVAGGGPTDDYANADIIASGSVAGSYVDTQASDNGYESITEVESGGKPSNRHSLLEHKWTVNVTGGNSVTFYVEAYKTANSEGDDFIFSYSTDNVNFTDMVTVTKTADDNVAQSYALPNTLSGTVYIRVTDSDSTAGQKVLDTVTIDEMYIRSDGTPPPNQAPSFSSDPVVEANATESSAYSASIADNASDPESDPMTFSKVSGPAWLSVASNGALSGTPGAGDVGLNSFTVQVDATGGSDTATLQITVDAAGTITDIYISDITMSSASYGGNRISGIATITVKDEFGATVSGASVSVDWSGATSSSASGATDGSGMVVFQSAKVKNGGTYTVTVTDVTASGYNYNPSLNVETSDSITAP